MKYPIGIQNFEKLRNEGWLYIDKTDLVYQLATTSSVCFLSRPRRFGKSLLVSTLECYFSGKKELFQGLAIDRLETEWRKHPVFKIDFNGDDFSESGVLADKIEGFIANAESIYGKNPAYITQGDRFTEVLRRACEQTGERAVVLIDEYDKPVLDAIETPQEDANRNTLRAFYSALKSADQYLRFAMLTGVTKFSQVSVFSGFNQPADISMSPQYEAICGITQEELETYFAAPMDRLAQEYSCSKEEIIEILKKHYDGYHFGRKMTDIYNPFSLLNAFYTNTVSDFWYASGTPAYLGKLLKHNSEQINELAGKYYPPEQFVDYRADVEKPLPMIYQSGYLTIRDYDMEENEFLLDFPNEEVRKGFLTMVADDYMGEKADISSFVSSGIRLLKKGNIEPFMDAMTGFFARIAYDSHGSIKDSELMEKHFQYTFYLVFLLLGGADGRLLNEIPQAVGRADCILEYQNFVYVIEFKLDGSAEDALRQIEEKRYALPYKNDRRTLYKVGVNFSSQTRNIEEWKIRQD